jgi:dihydropyrimidinase
VAKVPLYIVHLSSSDALDEVKRARARGIDVMAETCPQYLLLDETIYDRPNFEGAKWVMTPALREKWNQEVLWEGLRFGHLATIATDHCPFCFKEQKELGRDSFTKIPNGAPGVENRMSLIFQAGVVEGRLTLNRFVELTSTAAAKTFGLFPKKGTIAVGSDADIVIFDPDRTETISKDNDCTHHMRVDYSAWEGHTVQGFTETVLSRPRHHRPRDHDHRGRRQLHQAGPLRLALALTAYGVFARPIAHQRRHPARAARRASLVRAGAWPASGSAWSSACRPTCWPRASSSRA